MEAHIMPHTGHQFALFSEVVSTIQAQEKHIQTYVINQSDLVHRILNVLRLEKGELLILFNKFYHVTAVIWQIQPKKNITLEILSIEQNRQLKPYITWGLPLLKKDAFEQAIYTLAELGAQRIQPLLTQKTQRPWHAERELERYQKIIIASCEQSKQYCIPDLLPIMTLDLWLLRAQNTNALKLFFDAKGLPCIDVMKEILVQKPQHIIAISGPEGDLTEQEKDWLKSQEFVFCRLTDTILRAQQAISVGLGILRSLM